MSMYIFMQPRLKPVGNTFLNRANMDWDEEEEEEEVSSTSAPSTSPAPALVRRRVNLRTKSQTIPEYIPHHISQKLGEGAENVTQPNQDDKQMCRCEGTRSQDDLSTTCSTCSRPHSKDPSRRTSTASDATTASGPLDMHEGPIPDGFTTLVLRNLPHNLSQTRLAHDLDNFGFSNCYDFLYMPSTFASQRNKGYAFVNCVSPEEAKRMIAELNDSACFTQMKDGLLRLHVSPAAIQGYDANVARWNTSKMRRIRSDNHRPLVLTKATGAPLAQAAPPATLAKPAPGNKRMTSLRAPTVEATDTAEPASPEPRHPDLFNRRLTLDDLDRLVPVSDDVGDSLVNRWCVIHGLTDAIHANGLWGFVQARCQDGGYMLNVFSVQKNTWFSLKVFRQNLSWLGPTSQDQAPLFD